MLTLSLMFSLLTYFGAADQSVSLIPSFLWTICFLFMADALRRIRIVMKQLENVSIIFEMFVLYAFTAALAILGQIPVVVIAFDQKIPTEAYTVVTIMNNVIIMLF